jgi:hypothetical protein
MTAPIASGWSGCRVGLAPTGKRRLFTAHTRSGQRWILANDGLSVTICALAVVSYPAFLGRLASLYTLTLAIISPLPQGRGISLILLFWQRAPDFRSSRMAVRRTFSLKAVSNIRGANFFEPAELSIYPVADERLGRVTGRVGASRQRSPWCG